MQGSKTKSLTRSEVQVLYADLQAELIMRTSLDLSNQFSVLLPDPGTAERLFREIESGSFFFDAVNASSDTGSCRCTLTKRMVADMASLTRLAMQLTDMAEALGGEYLGWTVTDPP